MSGLAVTLESSLRDALCRGSVGTYTVSVVGSRQASLALEPADAVRLIIAAPVSICGDRRLVKQSFLGRLGIGQFWYVFWGFFCVCVCGCFVFFFRSLLFSVFYMDFCWFQPFAVFQWPVGLFCDMCPLTSFLYLAMAFKRFRLIDCLS